MGWFSIITTKLRMHMYSFLFLWILVEQGGMPVPSAPIMVTAGTMSRLHTLNFGTALGVILLGCLISDSMWFFLGRRFGRKVLNVLCRFSLEVNTCVTKTQLQITRKGPATMLFAKFLPGVNTMAAPVAGQSQMSYAQFVLYDMLGSTLWATSWLLAGRLFGDVLRTNQAGLDIIKRFAVLLLVLAVVAVVVSRIVKKQQLKNEVRGLRLEPLQLKSLLAEAQEKGTALPYIVDLRHPLDVLTDPRIVPGAVRITPEDLRKQRDALPKDREVVLYCTCPSEETSAKVAIELRKLGVQRVRPLRGGLQGWIDAGCEVEAVELIQIQPAPATAR